MPRARAGLDDGPAVLRFRAFVSMVAGMKRTLLFLAVLGFIITSQADVLVERTSQTSRYTGQGRERTLHLNNIAVRNLTAPTVLPHRNDQINGHKLYHVNREGLRPFTQCAGCQTGCYRSSREASRDE